MTDLDGAVMVGLGALCLLNLLFVLAIARRLRLFGDVIMEGRSHSEAVGHSASFLLPNGSAAPEFTTISVDGVPISRDDLVGQRSLIVFLLANCAPCHKQLPDFVRYAPTVASQSHVLAVISGQGDEVGSVIRSLKDVATVVVDKEEREIGSAFSVRAYPTFYLLDEEGAIQRGGATVQHLAAGALGLNGQPAVAVRP